jgi:hypothetical protein
VALHRRDAEHTEAYAEKKFKCHLADKVVRNPHSLKLQPADACSTLFSYESFDHNLKGKVSV